MSTKHTPGPWIALGIADHGYFVGPLDCGGAPCCAFVHSHTGVSDDEVTANALLIAAAPAMAEVLDIIICRLQDDTADRGRPDTWSSALLIDTAKAALPKGTT